MPKHFISVHIHLTFSTKERYGWIHKGIRSRVHGFLADVVRRRGAKALIVGGTDDHCHLLIRMDGGQAICELVREVKSRTSRWINREFPALRGFAWQTGYGAFSVNKSGVDAVYKYIQNQEKHHHQMTFQEEFLLLLKRHNLDYDPKYIWAE